MQEAEITLRSLERGGTLPRRKGKCRVCRAPLPKNRRSFCTDDHRELYYLATSSEFLRYRVFERDKGVCANCGEDCDALEVRVFGASTMLKRPRQKSMQCGLLLPVDQRTANVKVLIANGYRRLTSNWPRTLWEADHIEPLIDGGSFRLDNVCTLCQPCHIAKTSNEAKWRAKRKKLVGKKQTETLKRFRKMGLR